MHWLKAGGLAASVLLPVASGGYAVAQDACQLEPGPLVAVQRVIDGETIGLADGTEARLLNVLPEASLAYPAGQKPDTGEAARALEALLGGGTVQLAFDGRRQDRHGRWLAHLYVGSGEERVWVQGHLVERGLAAAHPLAGARACLRALQALEDRARTKRLGLWRSAARVSAQAWQTKALLARMNAFQIVEGRVMAAAQTRAWTFLNFGSDWRQDFTVAIAARDRRLFEGSDVDLAALQGAFVRVRGWIESWNGPVIKATHPEQIEVLEPGAAPAPTAAGEGASPP